MGVTLSEPNRSFGMESERIEVDRVSLVGHLTQTVTRRPGPLHLAGGKHDLHARGQAPDKRELVDSPGNRRVDCGHRRINPASVELHEREPGLRCAPVLLSARVLPLSTGEVALQAGQLSELVVGHSDRRSRGIGEPVCGGLGVGQRGSDVAVHLEDLGPVHQALATIGHELGLGIAPSIEGPRPLTRPLDIECPLASIDHRTVDDAGHDRRDVAASHGQHHLIKTTGTGVDVARRPPRLTDAEACHRSEIGIVEPPGDRQRLFKMPACVFSLAAAEAHQPGRNSQIAGSNAVEGTFVDQPVSGGDPSSTVGRLSSLKQAERRPEGAHHRKVGIVRRDVGIERTGPGIGAFLVPTGEIRRSRPTIKVTGRQSRPAFGRCEGITRLDPSRVIEQCSRPGHCRLGHDVETPAQG